MRDDLEKVLMEIGDQIPQYRNYLTKYSLMHGQAGVSLFYYHLYKFKGEEDHGRLAMDYLRECVTAISEESDLGITFSYGLAGIGWLINYYVQVGFVEEQEEAIFEDIDQLISNEVSRCIGHSMYDPMSGYLGYVNYLFQRPHNDTVVNTLNNIVEGLWQTKITVKENTYTWEAFNWDFYYQDAPKEKYNLGLAHGIPGIIACLSKIYPLGIQNQKVKDMITGGVAWLLDQACTENEDRQYRIPSVIRMDGERRPSRLSWCYGDLGVAVALLKASNVLDNREFVEMGRELSLNSAKRSSNEYNSINEGGICHGAAGNAHLFFKLNKYLNQQELGRASEGWYRYMLALRRTDAGVAGFQSLQKDHASGGFNWFDDPSILTGAAGIGLSIISTLSDEHLGWDAPLLLS